MKPADAVKVLDDLCEVLEWFLERYEVRDGAVLGEGKSRLPPQLALHVLLIEEGAANRLVATRLLGRHGCTVVEASSAREADDVLGKQSFDLILTQAQLNGMDGPTLTLRVRDGETACASDVFILGMTSDEPARRRCIEAGIDGCIARPVRLPELVDTIQGLCPIERLWKAVDVQHALEAIGGDRSLLRELVKAFVDERQPALNGLRDAIASRDGATLWRRAHEWKGSFHFLGARTAFDLAYRLQYLGSQARQEPSAWQDAETTLSQLERESSVVCRALMLHLAQ